MTTSQAPPELPKTFKAMTYDDPGKISTKMDEHPLPEPEAGQVLIHLYVKHTPYFLSLD